MIGIGGCGETRTPLLAPSAKWRKPDGGISGARAKSRAPACRLIMSRLAA